ncbi:alpha/beta fold hydrolase [Streptomyces noursei]|uniref:alpha/beta fold hydrolase n=1 Tax=Streptomyces noursei TaxID=1971 RepID=UPI001964596B|nr:alpha/beta fold hydrolase [Streptomyces noursei]QRX96413.1 alpha/beta fold hydrolase [Streptomyces noursei]
MKFVKKIAAAVFAPAPVSRDRALGLSERLTAVTTLTSSLEYLSQRKEIRQGGLNDWNIVKDVQAQSTPVVRRLLNAVSGPRTTTALHLTRATVAAGMLLPGNSRWRGAGNIFLGASSALLYPRHRYGTDGSDQVAILVQTATGAARLTRSAPAKDALLWYVALQANLSYLISGWVKLIGEPWRDASALGGVMRTRTYGHPGMFRWTQDHPKAAKYLTHGVLALECLFPLAYACGGRLARPLIASAAAFHLANGYFMGLGRFVTAFTAMHPMVAYTSTPRSHPAAAGRDDRALPAALALLAAATAAAMGTAVQRRLRATEGWHTSRVLTTRHGNELQYEVLSPGDGTQPVFVFAAGMVSTSEHFAWITERLAQDTEHGVLTYARAGYAGSRYRSPGRFTLGQSVDDLVDLVNGAVAPHRKVILVGHSLGGEIARRAAQQLGDRLHGVVYLDASHPDELNRSQQQRDTAGKLRTALTQMTWYLRLGTGILMARPDWLESLPVAYRKKVFAQYADVRMWDAGRREWNAVEADFRAFSGALTPIHGAHGLVVSAQQTVDRDPDQLLMHKELADAHRDGRTETVVIEGAGHDTVLTMGRYAHQVADCITEFFGITTTGAPGTAAEPTTGMEPGK